MRCEEMEWRYAEPIARALVDSRSFRGWALRQIRFDAHAEKAELLHGDEEAPQCGRRFLMVLTLYREMRLPRVFGTGDRLPRRLRNRWNETRGSLRDQATG